MVLVAPLHNILPQAEICHVRILLIVKNQEIRIELDQRTIR